MLNLSPATRILVAVEPLDMRRGFNLVESPWPWIVNHGVAW